jgi:hypothetical protein
MTFNFRRLLHDCIQLPLPPVAFGLSGACGK